MRNGLVASFMIGSALLLTGCGDKDGAAGELEKGQVVATIDGKDVTIHELNAELQGVALPSGERRKAVEQAALQQIVNRRILANMARERGLDKTPMYLLQQRRAEEALLVQLFQRQVASQVKTPTRQEAEQYIAANPDYFAQRKIFTVDQIQFEQPEDLNRLRAFEPLKTMDEVQQRLVEDSIKYRRANATLDVVQANPDLVAQVLRLPKDEIFIIPTGRAVLANKIVDTRVVPFGGAEAIQYATQAVRNKKLTELAKNEIDPKLKTARDAVKYQGGYAPPATATTPAAASPGPATPAAKTTPAVPPPAN